MKNYSLSLPTLNDLDEAMEIRRRHRTLILNFLDLNLLDLVRNHHLTTLKVHEDVNSTDVYLTDLIEVLDCLPSLETLWLRNLQIIDDVQNEAEKVCVKLKNLWCPYKIIHIFDCESIQDLTVENNMSPRVELTRQEEFTNFLNRQNRLESLTLFGVNIFKILPVVTSNFHLKKFDFWSTVQNFVDCEKMIKFLDFHKLTLTTLSVKWNTMIIRHLEQIQCYVLENLLNLKSLVLDIAIFSDVEGQQMISFDKPYGSTYVTENLETFYFDTRYRTLDENMRFISMFPNIKHLNMAELINHNNQLMHFASTTIQNLESFNFSFVCFDVNNVPFFPNLKEFTVQGYVKLELFVTRHANTLETINFNSLMHYFFTSLLAEEIFKCTNLNRITFNIGNIGNFTKIVSILHEKWPRTKTLAIVFRGLNRSTTFKLPEDSLFLFSFNPRDHNLIF